MSHKVFADTAGWIHFFDTSQLLHQQAKTLLQHYLAIDSKLITSNYILTEIVALMHKMRWPTNQIVLVCEKIKTSDWVQVVHITPELDEKAWQLLKNRADKQWSLVDCSSFVLMKELNIQEAFTSDHHFEQAGFHRLLKS